MSLNQKHLSLSFLLAVMVLQISFCNKGSNISLKPEVYQNRARRLKINIPAGRIFKIPRGSTEIFQNKVKSATQFTYEAENAKQCQYVFALVQFNLLKIRDYANDCQKVTATSLSGFHIVAEKPAEKLILSSD